MVIVIVRAVVSFLTTGDLLEFVTTNTRALVVSIVTYEGHVIIMAPSSPILLVGRNSIR